MNSPPSHPPQELPVNGSTIDWDAALTQHESWMRTVVRARLRDSHAADEVMQEIALAVLRQDSRPTVSAKVAPWLYRVAVRQVVNYRRRSGRQQQLTKSVAVSTAHEQTAAATSRDWVVASEDHQTVVVALGELSPDDREILLLKYTEDWTYRQLANHLGLKVKTIEHRLMKARRALRRRLHERGFEAD